MGKTTLQAQESKVQDNAILFEKTLKRICIVLGLDFQKAWEEILHDFKEN